MFRQYKMGTEHRFVRIPHFICIYINVVVVQLPLIYSGCKAMLLLLIGNLSFQIPGNTAVTIPGNSGHGTKVCGLMFTPDVVQWSQCCGLIGP